MLLDWASRRRKHCNMNSSRTALRERASFVADDEPRIGIACELVLQNDYSGHT
jgi:hypothetical protein